MKNYLIKRFGVSVDMVYITMDADFYKEDDIIRDDEGDMSLIRLKFDNKVIMSKLNWFGELLYNWID